MACRDEGKLLTLTSYDLSKSGDEWILEDAGNGYYYIKNNYGCYWTYQEPSNNGFVKCTIDKSSAVKISLTWDAEYSGVCFWNEKDGYGLSPDAVGGVHGYKWCISPDKLFVNANIFDIALLKEDGGNDFAQVTAVVDGIRYRFDTKQKTAEVLENGYSGDIVIPENVIYNNIK